MTKKIYLAGPGVFYADPIAEGERLKAKCAVYALKGLYPMDSALDLSTMTKHDAAQAIYDANIAFIREADAVLADMQAFRGPGMDGGTAFEMGFALALGKPVVGYGAHQTYVERCRAVCGDLTPSGPLLTDSDGLTVEDFDLPDNLMMACGATTLVADEDAALARLVEHFKTV